MPGLPQAAAPAALRHRLAVMNTLSWAEQSAAKGDYVDAIAWLDVITAIGDELPEPYPARRASWQAALTTASPSGEARFARLRAISDDFPSGLQRP